MSLRYLIWSGAAPGNLLVLGLAAGLLFLGFGRGRFGRFLIGLSALGFVSFLVLPLGRWAVDPLEDRFPVPKLTQPIDGILLLTGAIDVRETTRRGQPIFSGYAERVTATAALAHRFPGARLLVSGGSFDPTLPSEAAAHRDLLVAMGIDGARILTEEHARNTCESALFSYQQMPAAPSERWVLVTSAFHMPRAIACFRHVGWNIVPFPAGYLDHQSDVFALVGNLHVFDLALHEWVGLVAYRLLGETDAVFPAADANETAAPKSPPVTAMPPGGG
jgi:uncharacterized SAM-binding protein YcdF (DUF218 family)